MVIRGQLRLTIGEMTRSNIATLITEDSFRPTETNDVAGDVAIADLTHEQLG